jgi:hypothetical protein
MNPTGTTSGRANWRFDDVDVSSSLPIGVQAANRAGSAGVGQMRLRANVQVATNGQTGSYGPFFGGATGGWNDHLTITAIATAYAMALQGQTYGNVQCESNFANGLVWNGIHSVIRSSDSQPVDYTVSASSGLDYTQPVPLTVPEPGAESLDEIAVCGVCLVARIAHARRSAPSDRV